MLCFVCCWQLIYKLGRSNGKTLKASQVYKFDAGKRPIMNCAAHPTANVLAVGMDNKCQLLEMHVDEEVKNSQTTKGRSKVVVKETTKKFTVSELQSKVTVSAGDNEGNDDDSGFQKVVRFTANGEHIITGGSDGHVRVLQVSVLSTVLWLNAHSYDVLSEIIGSLRKPLNWQHHVGCHQTIVLMNKTMKLHVQATYYSIHVITLTKD